MAKTDKQKAWDAFAKYIKVRDCLETTGLAFVGVCITCKKQFHISILDAGHFNSGRRNAVLFQEKGVHAQCKHWCNRALHGDHKKYRKILIEKYDLATVKELEAAKNKVIQDKNMNFKAIEKEYKEKYINLMQAHGFKTWSQLLREGK